MSSTGATAGIATTLEESDKFTPRGRRAVRGAFFGFFVDYFDIYLPVVALAPALGYFEPTNIAAPLRTTLFYITFAVTLIGRPLGAFIFGHLGDVIGRKRATVIAISGAGVATLLTGLLPGYHAWGYGALALLTFLRLTGGTFMGGEYTSANPLALESTPQRLRGLVGGMIAAAYPCGYIAISIVTTIVLTFVPATGASAAYTTWGWRIPFFVGAFLVLLFLLYYRRVEESEAWQKAPEDARTTAPLRELFSGTNLRSLAQVFLLMSGMWFGVQAAISSPSGLLIDTLGLPSQSVTNGLLIANVFLAAGYVTMGVLGQRYGRRRMLMLAGVWTAIVSPIFYGLMVSNAKGNGSFPLTIVFATLQLLLAVAPWGIVTTYIVERFPTGVRSSGYGIGYSLAVIIPSFYSFYMLGLSRVMPYAYTPLVLLVIGGALALIGAVIGPETRHTQVTSATALRPARVHVAGRS